MLTLMKYHALQTVNSEFFARILFSRIALKHIFATLKIHDNGVILILILVNDRVISPIREDFIFTKLRKFRENKTFAKLYSTRLAVSSLQRVQ